MTSRPTTEDDITAEVLGSFEGTPDARLRHIMQSLVRHLHGFIKDVALTEAEWFEAIQFLTDTGQTCSDRRQEFILLSDTLGASMIVDLLSHRQPVGATESTVFGPFHRAGSPELPAGGNIAPRDMGGLPAFVSGRVVDLAGRPIPGALLDVWQADSNGLYDSQIPGLEELQMRGLFRTDGDGRFLVRTVRPVHYALPSDGPVGRMLRATSRHAWRPAHIHFVVSAEGFEPVTTHIFDDVDPYIESDTVFAVKQSLIRTFAVHNTGDGDAIRLGVDPPFCTVQVDFVLSPARAASPAEARLSGDAP